MEETMDLLTENLFRLEMLLHRHYHIHSHSRMENPHKGQGRVLMLLYKCGQLSQRELPYLLDMRQQSVSELLLKLEKKNLIKRSVSDEEKRGTMVSLTEAGLTVSTAAEKEKKSDGAGDIFSCLQEDERKAFEGYLQRIIEALEARLPDLPPQPYGHPYHHEPEFHPHEGFPRPKVRNLSETGNHHEHHGTARSCSMEEKQRGRGPHRHGCPHGEGCPHSGHRHGKDAQNEKPKRL